MNFNEEEYVTSREERSFGTPQKRSASAPLSPAVEKLYKVKEGLNSLSGDLRSELEYKRELTEHQIQELRGIVTKLEKKLLQEMKKRADNERTMQNIFKHNFATFEEQMEKKFADKFESIQITLDVTQKRVSALEKAIQEFRDFNQKSVNDLKLLVLSQVEEMKSSVDTDKVSRQEKETQNYRKLAEDIYHMSEKFTNEKERRDKAFHLLREEIQKIETERVQSFELFKGKVIEELNLMKQQLKNEVQNRETSQEQIALQIEQIVNKLKEGFRMVTKR